MQKSKHLSVAAVLESSGRVVGAGDSRDMVKRMAPWLVLAAFVAYLAAVLLASPSKTGSGFNLGEFRRLPVSVSNRVQPFDSVARIALLRIRGSATVPLEASQAAQAKATALDANEWLLEVLARPDAADTRKIFPVEDRQVLAKLSMKPAGRGTDYYSFLDFVPKVQQIGKEAQRINTVKPEKRAPWERELVALQSRLIIYERLKNSVQPNSLLQRQAKGKPITFDFARELGRYRADLAQAVSIATLRKNGGKELLDPATEQRLRAFSGGFQAVSSMGIVGLIPPPPGQRGRWSTTGSAIVSSSRGGPLSLGVAYFASMMSAFARGDANTFNDRLGRYQKWIQANAPARAVRQAGYEAFYNVLQPFIRALCIYAVGFALLLVAWWKRSTTVYRSAALLVLLAFALHTTGLMFTIALAGRPSFLAFTGWAVAMAALVVEAFWRRRLAMGAATVTALSVLVYSYAFSAGGAAAIGQTVVEPRLLVPTAAVVAALGLAVLVRRLAATRETTAGTSRSRWGYVVGSRSLGTE